MERHAFVSAFVATMQPYGNPYGLIENGCVVVDGSMVAWVGPQSQVPKAYATYPKRDFGPRLIAPALIDCHTHLVYGGDRSREFELRLEGASYEEIARAGGGIVSTVKATREATEDDLLKVAVTRLDALLADGVGTVEVKSGYGLETETELKMLRVARRLGEMRPVNIMTTFLGAHTVPPEFGDQADAYIDLVCREMMDAVVAANLADAVDGFCESIAFTPDQIARVFDAARKHGLPIKLHAEQLSNLGAAALAARYGALSADHLEYLGADGIDAMAGAGTVAVLLPGAFYALREIQLPPVDGLRDAKVPIAIATDCNPGSSPLVSPLLAMNMACTLFRLTPEEALAGLTRNAAMALGLGKGAGTIAPGAPANLSVWDVSSPAALAYMIGHRPLHARIHGGRIV